MQEKSLELTKRTSALSVKLAQVNEAGFFPTAPQTAVVEKIHVRFGQAVVPGTPLITLASPGKTTIATALVPAQTAKSISQLDPTFIKIAGEQIEATPYFVSQQATDGLLFSARFIIPDENAANVSDSQYIEIDIPITTGTPDSPIIFVPLDAVRQTQDQTTVFTSQNETVVAKKVTLGTIRGNYVEIVEGLSTNDIVILDRSTTVGQKITPN